MKGLMNEGSEELVDFLRRENLILARRDRWGKVLGDEQAVYRVRAALEEDVWSDRDPHGQLQKYLDALQGNPS